MKRSLLSIALLISTVVLFASNGFDVKYTHPKEGVHQLQFTLGDYSVTNVTLQGEQYSRIVFEGKVVTEKKGFAELPYLNASVMLDPMKNVFIGILPGSYEEISLDHPLVPSRGVIYRSQDPETVPYVIDPKSVTDAWYPVDLAQQTDPFIIRDIRGTSVYVYPFQYNPVRQVLRVYKSVTVRLVENYSLSVNPLPKEPSTIVREMDAVYRSVFINYDMNRDNLTIGEFGDIHVIVTSRDASAIEPYVEWKRQKGFNVDVEVVSTGTVVNSNVQAAYNANNNILYVLLVGDWADLQCTTSGAGRPQDPFVGAVVGSDDFADIAVGRFSANSPADVTVQVNKVISYEREPEMGATWYNYATGLASAEGAGIGDDGESDIVHETVIYDDKLDPFTYTNFTQIFDPGATAAMVTTAVNAGTSVINYTGHGWMDGWGTTGFSSSNVAALTNGNKLPFVMSVACDNGDFDLGTCFAESWLRKENGGAIMFLGASISQPWAEPMRGQDYFMDILIGGYDYSAHPGQSGISTTEQRTTLGSIVFNGFTLMCTESGGSSDWETAKTWNIFGDPSVQPRTATPLELSLTNTLIMVGIPFTTVVTSSEGPVANAMVTLSQDGAYYTGVTDASGSVTIEQGLNPGNAKLVVTAFNTETIYEDESVIPPNGPYIAIGSVVIDDAAGNANGQWDYNETVYLTVGLVNVGTSEATNVSAVISSIDEFTDILDNTADFGTIPAGDTVFVTEAFQVQASATMPDLHYALFDLSASSGVRDTWVSSFSLTGHAPLLGMVGYTIDDAGGNSNGRLDPGETAQITVSAGNSGSSGALQAIGALSCSNTNITVTNSPLEYGDIAAGATAVQTFEVSVSSDTPTGEPALFSFDLTAGLGILGHGEFVEYIGQIPVLLVDMDGNHNSPDVIEQSLINLEVAYDRVTALPADVNLYASIFVCLGVYSDNHVLTVEEGQALADYLNAGGSLYMEGADTWFYDPANYPPTAVHPMFNITGLEDGGSDLTILNGLAGSIVEGMSYTFSGDNNYIDHIDAMAPAQVMFLNNSPAFAAMISYDAGSYRTIGSSCEFGGLQDGDKSKDDLMIQILEFFNIQGVWTDIREEAPLAGITSGCYPNPFNNQTVISFETVKTARVTVDIFNINGEMVDRIADAEMASGRHDLTWFGTDRNGTRLAGGIYFYQVKTGNETATGKLVKLD